METEAGTEILSTELRFILEDNKIRKVGHVALPRAVSSACRYLKKNTFLLPLLLFRPPFSCWVSNDRSVLHLILHAIDNTSSRRSRLALSMGGELEHPKEWPEGVLHGLCFLRLHTALYTAAYQQYFVRAAKVLYSVPRYELFLLPAALGLSSKLWKLSRCNSRCVSSVFRVGCGAFVLFLLFFSGDLFKSARPRYFRARGDPE